MSPDWLFSNNSNVHVAKDRGWFTQYTPFVSAARNGYQTPGHPLRVEGIGIVEIPVKRSPELSGPEAEGILVLHDVLHIPSFICNIVGYPVQERYNVDTEEQGEAVITLKNMYADESESNHVDSSVAYFNRENVRILLKLSGPPVGPSLFQEGQSYLVSVIWPDNERARFEMHAAGVLSEPYTEEEERWLVENYGSEDRFLQHHDWDVRNTLDRDSGREFLRVLMAMGPEGIED